MQLSWQEFEKMDMRVGTIIGVADFPAARKPAYKLSIDFGPEIGVLRSSAQLTVRYTTTALLGRQIVAVVNFPPKQIADFISECLVLGATGPDGDVILLQPDVAAANGSRIG